MIERRFRRIDRRLTVAELTEKPKGAVSTLLGFGDASSAGVGLDLRFLDFYSRVGMQRMIRAYGIDDRLTELGLGHYELEIGRREPAGDRLQLLLDGVRDDDHRLVDLMVSRRSLREQELTDREDLGRLARALYVEWIVLQNPRGAFSADRPPLPGQRYPGLGLGATLHNMVLLMARRLGFDAVMNIPERLHLAQVYRRMGYESVDPEVGRELKEVTTATSGLPSWLVAWAAELGALRRVAEDGAAEPWSYRPAPVIAPLSRRVRRRLPRAPWWRRLRARSGARYLIDRDHLLGQLEARPVEGLDPRTVRDLLGPPGC